MAIYKVCTYEISEELFQPVVHDLVVVPSLYKFGKKKTIMGCVESWQDSFLKIVFNALSVAFVQSLRPIVRCSLCAHVVTFPVVTKITYIKRSNVPVFAQNLALSNDNNAR